MGRFRRHDTATPSVLGLFLALLAGFSARGALLMPWLYDDLRYDYSTIEGLLRDGGVNGLCRVALVFLGLCAVVQLLAGLLAFARRGWVLSLVRKALILSYLEFWLLVYGVHRVTSIIHHGANLQLLPYMDGVGLFFMRWDLLCWPLLALVVAAALHVHTWRRNTLNIYRRRRDADPAWGDRVLENIRTHGADPVYRKSWWTSALSHVMVIVIIPWLLGLIGCITPYKVPFGSGQPVVALVAMKKPQKPKKKKYLLNPNSAISFHVPDLDDSQILQQVSEMSELTYKANPNARPGRMGRGGGTEGGWPEGMKDGRVRFIRLEYSGSNWDDGMDPHLRADMNFLEHFHRLTKFRIGKKPESHPIRYLKKYPKGFAPPFVYMTGDGGIRTSGKDREILRDYLLDGGMLFADCGGPSFDRSFRHFIAATLPGMRLVTIADDDPIFQQPYTFPHGAPPLWHHGGNRAMGVKYKGRWCVFYHPGDINDAWKTGHSGLRPDLAEGAFSMGVNIVYYSFTNYLELTKKYRK